ncbi:hypothetical protein DACRYDRAFT_25497 [Dacryopinax primogenitus]|uniref:Uncharacterized protein n=1 Tax=Dacryopinax primogenitus (strain DJM 731) TaxID=1858805 RepID=M5FUB4_DACPD|nr:uncharacterized protein DACRYDRAFT_25497 [Dacryopinax primogenitus]EJT96826.1 hypothetical protein DACRYDRAFT_25497 [Dacryopinax primogenitus]
MSFRTLLLSSASTSSSTPTSPSAKLAATSATLLPLLLRLILPLCLGASLSHPSLDLDQLLARPTLPTGRAPSSYEPGKEGPSSSAGRGKTVACAAPGTAARRFEGPEREGTRDEINRGGWNSVVGVPGGEAILQIGAP